MVKKSLLKIAAGILFTAVVAAVGAVILLPRLLDLDRYRTQILTLVQKSLNRQVSYETASFSWYFGPSFVFRGITIKEKDGEGAFLKAEELDFKLALLPLLHKELQIRELALTSPTVALGRDRSGALTISDLFVERPSAYRLTIGSIRIKKGSVRFTDRTVDPEGFTTSLEGLDLRLNSPARGSTSTFTLSTVVPGEGGGAMISLSGMAKIPPQNRPIGETLLDATLTAKDLNAELYWPYYGRHLPFERVQGRLDFEGSFKGKPAAFYSQGNVRIRGLRLNYPQVFHAILTPKELRVNYTMELTSRNLSVHSLDLAVDGLRVTGSCALQDIDTNDMRITARAATNLFSLEEFGHYIPYGVIARDTANFIEQHIKGGVYRLDDGRLDGRISQILHMEKGENYNVLSIRARVEKGVVTLGPRVPNFTDIRGELEMRGKDFILRRMSGSFGSSPFTLEGKIADYPLDTPPRYPFTMTISPGQPEMKWLLRQEQSRDLSFSGSSVLRLSGSGTASDYRLAGEWELSRVDYRFKALIHKPAGLANRLSFTVSLGSTEARLSELRYELPPLVLTASATYRYDDERPLSFTATTNRFPVGLLHPLIPGLNTFQPKGNVQAELSGTGNPADAGTMSVNGTASVAGVSLRIHEQLEPLRALSGTIHIDRTTLATDQLTGMLGDSPVSFKGRMNAIPHLAADLVLSSPALNLKALGYRSPGEEVAVKNLNGSIFLKDGTLTITSLSGEVKSSTFTVNGDIVTGREPKIELSVVFPFLRTEDLAPLTRLTRERGEGRSSPAIDVHARVTAATGSVRNIPFAKLRTEFSLRENHLSVQEAKVSAFDGTVSTNGEADLAAAAGPLYRGRYRLEQLDAAQLLRALGEKRGVTGRLSAEGEFTARGRSLDEVKKSAAGAAQLHMAEGALHVSREGEIPITALETNLALKDEVLTVNDLNAGIFGGTVSGSGQVDFAGAGGPAYQARYRLDRVDAARLIRSAGVKRGITGLLSAEGELTAQGADLNAVKKSARADANLRLQEDGERAGAGAARGGEMDIPFKALLGRLSYKKNKLDVPSVQIKAFGGSISGKGEVDFSAPNGTGYQVDWRLDGIDAAEFFHALGMTSEVSGLLAMQGAVTARGDNVAEVKKSAQGSMGMHLENGAINKFRFISSIFSILNVSQLLKFQLPDMALTGLPFRSIDGNFSLGDGSLSTTDLVMNSSSLNMSVVGKADIVNREIDLKVGVQPFQTVGRIVSRIPVVGWILTGGDRSFLVTYFEATGNWDDPKVSAIPVKSLSRGTFDIFRRTLKLPDELVTDTGEVISGK